jgi:hypothetical protein
MKRIRHIFQALSLAFITLAFASAAWPTPASAAGLNLQHVSATSAASSEARKSVTVYCPPGRKVIGTGGQLKGRADSVAAIEGITPLADLSGVTLTGVEIGAGTPFNWSVEAFAICVDMVTSPVQSLQLVSARSPSNSSDAKSVMVNCPSGKRVVGAGGRVNGVTGKTLLDEITPLDTFVNVVGLETGGGTSADWSVEAFAICANPTSLPGLEIVKGDGEISSKSARSLIMTCPSGKRLLSPSGQLNAPSGEVALHQILPSSDLSGMRLIAFEIDGGTTASWSLTARVICAAV